jgi:hypothetical protein
MFTPKTVSVDDQQDRRLGGSDGVPALFALLDTVFDEQQIRIVEDRYGSFKSDAVHLAIPAALLLVPFVPYRYT